MGRRGDVGLPGAAGLPGEHGEKGSKVWLLLSIILTSLCGS